MNPNREEALFALALKVIKLGMNTKQVVARFEAERQALDVTGFLQKLPGISETARPRSFPLLKSPKEAFAKSL